MCADPQTTLAAKRSTVKALASGVPLVPSAQHIKMLDNLWLVADPRLGLVRFSNMRQRTTLGLTAFVETGAVVPPHMFTTLLDHPHPSLLAIGRDEEQVQICAENIAADGLALSLEGFSDFAHRTWNDNKNSLKRSGFWFLKLSAILIYNVGYGPWATAAFYHQLLEHASAKVANLRPDGELVKFFWKAILKDRGDHQSADPDVSGLPARTRLVATLKYRLSMLLINDKCSQKSFFSMNKAHRQ